MSFSFLPLISLVTYIIVLVSSPRIICKGGLLMGNMYTMRPDLFGAIHCAVPLLDMKRYNTLLAGASWVSLVEQDMIIVE